MYSSYYKTNHVLDTKALTSPYNAVISPYLNYCVEVLGNIYKTNLYPLFIRKKESDSHCLPC